jgi:hypothetical protein
MFMVKLCAELTSHACVMTTAVPKRIREVSTKSFYLTEIVVIRWYSMVLKYSASRLD